LETFCKHKRFLDTHWHKWYNIP